MEVSLGDLLIQNYSGGAAMEDPEESAEKLEQLTIVKCGVVGIRPDRMIFPGDVLKLSGVS